MSVTVTWVNDPPVAVDDSLSAVNEDSGQRTVPFTDLTGNDSRGPTNETGQTLTVTAVTNPVGGTASISGSNVLFTPAANFFGTASFDYTVADDGTSNGAPDPKTDVGQASFTVNAVNDPPTFTPGANVAVNEDSGAFSGRGRPRSAPGPARPARPSPSVSPTPTTRCSPASRRSPRTGR